MSSASGVPKRSTAWGTSVAITSTSALDRAGQQCGAEVLVDDRLDAAQVAVGRRAPPGCRRRRWRRPRSPASTSACTAGASMISSGSGEATTRRQPFSPRSSQVSPCSTSSCGLLGRQEPADRLGRPGEARVVAVDERAGDHGRGAALDATPRPAPRRARPSARSRASPGSGRRTSPAGPGVRRPRRARSSPAGCRPAGPLPCVITTSTSCASRSATASIATSAAAIWSSARARPSALVMALPPSASRTLMGRT